MSGYSVEAILRATDKNFTRTMREAQRCMEDVESSIDRVSVAGKRIEGVGRVMTAGLTLPLVAAGAAALKVGADFDESMTTVRARTGMAADEVEKLGSNFRSMAASGRYGSFTAREIASAYSGIALYGQDAAHGTEVMRKAMVLATAVGDDLASTANFLGGYLDKVGKDASYAEKYINLFAATNRKTGISLGTLQDYLFRANSSLQAANISGTEASAVFGRLYRAGVKGANAYSGFQQAIETMLLPSEEQIDVFNRLGIEVESLEWQNKSTMEQFYALGDAMAEVTDGTEQLDMMTTLFTQQSARAFADELFNQRNELRAMIPELYEMSSATDGMGVAFEMAGEKQETLAAQGRLLRGRLEEVGLQIATQLMPHAIRLVDAISRLVERFSSLSPAAQRSVVIFGMVAASIGPVLIVIGRMVQAYAKLKAGIQAAKATVTAWKATQALAATAEKAKMAATYASANATNLAKKAEMSRKLLGAKHAKTIMLQAKAEKAQATAIALNAKAHTAMAAASGKVGIVKKALGIIVAIVTKKQIALNVAMWANPIGIIIAAVVAAIAVIAALAIGIAALIRHFRRASEETKQLREDISELNDAVDDKNEALSESEDAFQSNMQSIRAQGKANRDLASSVTSLAAVESKSAGQRQILKGQIDQLSAALGGLVLYYDEEAGALNISNEELSKRIDLLEAQDSKNAGLERHAQILSEMHETTMKKAETNALLERAIDLQGEYSDEAEALREVLGGLETTYEELNVRLEVAEDYIYANASAVAELSDALEIFDDAVARSAEEYQTAQQAKIEAQEQFEARMQAWVEAQERAMDKLASTYTRISDEATNAFRKMETETDKTMESINATLAHNVQATIDWGDNIATIMDRATAKGVDEGVLAHMQRLAQENPAMASLMANATEAEFLELANNLEAASQASVDKMATVYGIDASVAEAARSLAHETSDSVRSAIEEADYKAMGVGIPHSLSDGIRSSAPNAEEAARMMAQNMEEAYRSTTQQNSPSQLYINLGEGIPDSIATGVSGNSSTAISAMEQMADQMVSALESGISNLDQVGNVSFAGIATSARTGMSQVTSAIRSGLSSSTSVMTAGTRNMSTAVQTSMRTMQTKVTTGMAQITRAIMQGTTQNSTAMTTGMTQMNNVVRSNFTTMQSTTMSGMTSMNNSVRTGAQMQSTMTSVMTGMNNTVRTNTQAMQSSTSASMTALGSSVSSGMNSARSSVTSATSGMTASVNTLQGSFRSAGSNAALGLRDGINANRSAAINAAQSLADSVSSTMRRALQVRSPSRITTLIGKFTGAGFVLGLMDKIREVKIVAQELAEAAIPQIAGGELAFAGLDSMAYSSDMFFDTTHTIIVPVEIDGRQVAKATVEYNIEEANVQEDRANRRRR